LNFQKFLKKEYAQSLIEINISASGCRFFRIVRGFAARLRRLCCHAEYRSANRLQVLVNIGTKVPTRCGFAVMLMNQTLDIYHQSAALFAKELRAAGVVLVNGAGEMLLTIKVGFAALSLAPRLAY
jgi:hypothetical protein